MRTPTTSSASLLSIRKSANPWLLATTVPLIAFMEMLDMTVVNVSLEHMAGALSSTVDEVSYVLTSYLIANVIVLPLSEFLSTLMGRKNYYLCSAVVFVISSAFCGFAPSLGFLVFFRVLQGLGGGGLQPISQAILVDEFPEEKRGTAQAIFSIIAITAPALGPTLGGWLSDNVSWRWVFLINIPIGIVALALNARLIQDPPHFIRRSFRDRSFDYQGLMMLALCLGWLQVVLDRGQIDNWFDSPFIRMSALISFVALIAFLWWELHHHDPVVNLRLLKNRNFALSVIAMFMMGVIFFASNYIQPLFCQQMLGWTATWAGLALSPGAIVFIGIMPVMPWLLKRMPAKYLVSVGFVINAIACLSMTGWNLQVPFETVLGTRIVQIIGLAVVMVPINILAFSFLAKEDVTGGSGLLSLARNFGDSCGVSIAATMLVRRAQVHHGLLTGDLVHGVQAYERALNSGAQRLFHYGVPWADAATKAIALVSRTLQQQAAVLSFIDVFWVLVIGSLIAAPIPLLILKVKNSMSTTGSAGRDLGPADA